MRVCQMLISKESELDYCIHRMVVTVTREKKDMMKEVELNENGCVGNWISSAQTPIFTNLLLEASKCKIQ